jgi:hypothetical protein
MSRVRVVAMRLFAEAFILSGLAGYIVRDFVRGFRRQPAARSRVR